MEGGVDVVNIQAASNSRTRKSFAQDVDAMVCAFALEYQCDIWCCFPVLDRHQIQSQSKRTRRNAYQPRNAVLPDVYAEDFSAALDFLGTGPFVDRARIGILGICGSGSSRWMQASSRPCRATVAEPKRCCIASTAAGRRSGLVARRSWWPWSPLPAQPSLAAIRWWRPCAARRGRHPASASQRCRSNCSGSSRTGQPGIPAIRSIPLVLNVTPAAGSPGA
jgi:hypothetical protein